nr:hypothetical protein [Tanacetum cinerariifolium]
MSISPAPEPSVQEDPSMNKIHRSGSSSSASIRVSEESYSGHLTMKSASICPLTDTLDEHLFSFSFRHQDCAYRFFGCRQIDDKFIYFHWLASFPFNFCTYFKHFGDGRLKTSSTLSRHTFSPLVLTLYPKNIPSSTPKVIHAYFKISSKIFVERFIHQTLGWEKDLCVGRKALCDPLPDNALSFLEVHTLVCVMPYFTIKLVKFSVVSLLDRAFAGSGLEASFLENFLLITLLLFPWWKRLLSLVIRGCNFLLEERCGYSHHFINFFGILSWRRLMSSGFVIPCTNPKICHAL